MMSSRDNVMPDQEGGVSLLGGGQPKGRSCLGGFGGGGRGGDNDDGTYMTP